MGQEGWHGAGLEGESLGDLSPTCSFLSVLSALTNGGGGEGGTDVFMSTPHQIQNVYILGGSCNLGRGSPTSFSEGKN